MCTTTIKCFHINKIDKIKEGFKGRLLIIGQGSELYLFKTDMKSRFVRVCFLLFVPKIQRLQKQDSDCLLVLFLVLSCHSLILHHLFRKSTSSLSWCFIYHQTRHTWSLSLFLCCMLLHSPVFSSVCHLLSYTSGTVLWGSKWYKQIVVPCVTQFWGHSLVQKKQNSSVFPLLNKQ